LRQPCFGLLLGGDSGGGLQVLVPGSKDGHRILLLLQHPQPDATIVSFSWSNGSKSMDVLQYPKKAT